MPRSNRFGLIRGGRAAKYAIADGAETKIDWSKVESDFRAGETEAIEVVAALISNFLRSKRLPVEDVEDLMMDTLVALEKSRDTSIRNFGGYAYTVARRKFVDWCRRRVDVEFINAIDDQYAPTQIDAETIATLEGHLGRLPAQHRRAIEYRYLAGKSEEETANALGVATSTVRKFLALAKAELFDRMVR